MATLAEALVTLGVDANNFVSQLEGELNKAAELAGTAFSERMDEEMAKVAASASEKFAQALADPLKVTAEETSAQFSASMSATLDASMAEVGRTAATAFTSALEAGVTSAGEEVTARVTEGLRGAAAGAGVAGAEAGGAFASELTATASHSTGGLAAAGEHLTEVFKGGVLLAVPFLADGLHKVFESAQESAAGLQQYTAAIAGFMTPTMQAQGGVNAFWSALQKLAAQSPFTEQDLMGVQQAMIHVGAAQGLGVQQTQDYTKAIVDAGAAVGLSGAQMGGLANVFAKIESQGKLTGGTVAQLQARLKGLDIQQVLNNGSMVLYGKSMDLAQAKTLNSAQALQVLTTGLEHTQGVTDAAKAHTDTLRGALTSLQSVLTTGIGTAMMPFFGGIVKNIVDMTSVLNTAKGPIDQLGQAMGQAFTQASASIGQLVPGIISALGPVVQLIGLIFQVAGPAFAAVTGAVQAVVPPLMSFINAITSAFQPIIDKLTPALAQLGTAFGQILGTAITALVPLIKPLADILMALLGAVLPLVGPLVQVAQVIGVALRTAITAFLPVLTPLSNAFRVLIAAIAPLIPQLITSLLPVIPALAQVVVALAPSLIILAQAFAQIITAITPLIPPLVQLLPPAISAMTPVLKGLATVVQELGPYLLAAGAALVIWNTAMGLGNTLMAAGKLAWAAFSFVMAGLPTLEEAATAAMTGLDVAMDANPIGLITLAILALIAVVVALVVYWKPIVRHEALFDRAGVRGLRRRAVAAA